MPATGPREPAGFDQPDLDAVVQGRRNLRQHGQGVPWEGRVLKSGNHALGGADQLGQLRLGQPGPSPSGEDPPGDW